MTTVERLEAHLDKFLPTSGTKCDLFKCTPGKIWMVLAAISVLGAANHGWRTLVSTIMWEVVVGWGIAWLCRGCKYGWLWTMLILFSGLPLLLLLVVGIAAASIVKTPSCASCSASN